jgi:hypothetical protein
MAVSLSFQPKKLAKIYARSPIFYKFEGCDPEQYTYVISLSATTGAIGTLTEYVTIDRTPDLQNYIIIDISNIIKNYIRLNFNKNTENAAYVQITLLEFDGTTVNSTVTSDVSIAVLGYTDYVDGFNYAIQSGESYSMSSDPTTLYLPNYGGTGATYSIPWSNENGDTYYKINFYNNSGSTSHLTYFFNVISDAKSTIRAVYVNYTDIITKHGVDYIDINKPITVEFKKWLATDIKTYIIKPEQCNGNELHVLKFINKFGCWDRIFIKANVEKSSKIEFETYKYNKVNRTNMTYSQDGTYHKLYSNGKTTYTVYTGWMNEDLNPKLEELLLSEYVYFDDNPVIITDKDIKYKTHKNDKLINYMLNLELAYDTINNII